MKLLNNQGRSDSMIIKNPTNYVDVIDQTEVPIENKYQIEPLYSWVHLACTLSVPDIFFTPKSPLKVSLESFLNDGTSPEYGNALGMDRRKHRAWDARRDDWG